MNITSAVSYNVAKESVRIHAMLQLPCQVLDKNATDLKQPHKAMVSVAKGIRLIEVTDRKVTTRLDKAQIEFICHINRTYVFSMYPDANRKTVHITFATEKQAEQFEKFLGPKFSQVKNDFFRARLPNDSQAQELFSNEKNFFLVNTRRIYLDADGNVDTRMFSYLNEMII